MLLTEFNIDSLGVKNYLSFGEASFPIIFLIFAIANTIISITWLVIHWRRRAFANIVHGLMSILIVLKTMSLYSSAVCIIICISNVIIILISVDGESATETLWLC